MVKSGKKKETTTSGRSPNKENTTGDQDSKELQKQSQPLLSKQSHPSDNISTNPFGDDYSDDDTEAKNTEPLMKDPLNPFDDTSEDEVAEVVSDNTASPPKHKKKKKSVIKGIKRRLSGRKTTKNTDEKQKSSGYDDVAVDEVEDKSLSKSHDRQDESVQSTVNTPTKICIDDDHTVTKKESTNPFGDSDDSERECIPETSKNETDNIPVQPRSNLKGLLNVTESLRERSEGLSTSVEDRHPHQKQSQSLPIAVSKKRPASESLPSRKEEKTDKHLSRKQKIRKSLPWRFKMKKEKKGSKVTDDTEEEIELEESREPTINSKERGVDVVPEERPSGKRENLGVLLSTTEDILDRLEQCEDTISSMDQATSNSPPKTHITNVQSTANTWPAGKTPSTEKFDEVDETKALNKTSSKPVKKSMSWRLRGKKKLHSQDAELTKEEMSMGSPSPATNLITESTVKKELSTPLVESVPAESYPTHRSITADQVRQVQTQVGAVTDAVTNNIKLLQERDHNLDELQLMAHKIEDTSTIFRKVSRRTRRKMWWQNAKWKLAIICTIVAAVVVIVIIIVIVAVTSGDDGTSDTNNQPQVNVVPVVSSTQQSTI